MANIGNASLVEYFMHKLNDSADTKLGARTKVKLDFCIKLVKWISFWKSFLIKMAMRMLGARKILLFE